MFLKNCFLRSLLLLIGGLTISEADDTDYNVIHRDGSYEFGANSPDSYHYANANRNNVVKGEFGGRNPGTGAIDSTVYTAGPRGYRPRGKNIARKYDLNQNGPRPIGSPDDPNFDPYEDPSYNFAFRTRTYERQENANRAGDVNGRYSYVDDVGERHNVEYLAGKNTGFHVKTPFPDSNPRSLGPLFFNGRGKPIPRGRTSIQTGLDGSYRFVSAGPDQRRTETSDSSGHVRGSYTYLDDKGVQHSVHYIAGPETGYRVLKNVKGPHLPTVFPFSHPNILPPDFYDYIDNKGSDFFDTAESNNLGGGGNKGGGGSGGGSGGSGSRPNKDKDSSFGGGGDFDDKDDYGGDGGSGSSAPSGPSGPSLPNVPTRPNRPSYRPPRPRPTGGRPNRPNRPNRPFGGLSPSLERPGNDDQDDLGNFGDLFGSNEGGGGGGGGNRPTGPSSTGSGGGTNNAYIPPSPGGTTYRPSTSTTSKPGIFVTPSNRPGGGRPAGGGSRPGGGRPGRPGQDFLDNDLDGDDDFNLFPSGPTGGSRPTGSGSTGSGSTGAGTGPSGPTGSGKPVIQITSDKNCRNCKGTLVTNVGDRLFTVPPGVSVRAHVQSIDLLPASSNVPSPSEQLKVDMARQTDRLLQEKDSIVGRKTRNKSTESSSRSSEQEENASDDITTTFGPETTTDSDDFQL